MKLGYKKVCNEKPSFQEEWAQPLNDFMEMLSNSTAASEAIHLSRLKFSNVSLK